MGVVAMMIKVVTTTTTTIVTVVLMIPLLFTFWNALPLEHHHQL